MKNFITSLLLLLSCYMSGQIYNPVKWTTTVEKISDKEYILKADATIQSGWHLYGQYIEDGGPLATTFTFKNKKKNFELIGKIFEGKGHEVLDKVFDMKIKYFEGKALFTQKVKFISNKISNINSEVEFMVCDDTNCLPPTTEELSFIIPNSKKTVVNEEVLVIKKDTFTTHLSEEKAVVKELQNGVDVVSVVTAKNDESSDLLNIFIIAFLSGFAALLTPCVFPMIPMTVSYFTKQSKTKITGIRNALIYGFSIIIIYVLLGAIVTAIFGADSLNALSTNVIFNLVFFVLLFVFAFSFLGAFELVLPHWLTNKVDQQSDRAGLIGIFFMALALAIVSFSCTGPIVGTLLVELLQEEELLLL